MLVCIISLLGSGCYSKIPMTSKQILDNQIDKIEKELNKMGYHLSGFEYNADNNIMVTGTSFSPKSGYGSMLGNNYVFTNTYTFTNDNAQTINYSVSYNMVYSTLDTVILTEYYDTTKVYLLSGDTSIYVKKKVKKESAKDYLVSNVFVQHCQTTKHEDFKKICGTNSITSQLMFLPKDKVMKK